MRDDLTDRQRRFVDEYLVDLNAAAAARRAGYSVKTADRLGSRLLSNPVVAAAIHSAQDERRERTLVRQDDVIAHLAAIAFADLRDVARWGEEGLVVLSSSEISDDAARALREVDARENHLTVRQHDKLRALELLGKHLGMFTERIQVRVGLGDVFEEVWRRANGDDERAATGAGDADG